MEDSPADGDDLVHHYRLLIADVYELAGLSRSTSEAIANATDGQTVARWHAMSTVSEEALTVPRMADRLGLARQSVQRVVDDLVESGHLELRPNPSHRRSPLVALTELGHATLRKLNAAAESVRAEQLRQTDLDVERLSAARGTLRALIAMLRGDA